MKPCVHTSFKENVDSRVDLCMPKEWPRKERNMVAVKYVSISIKFLLKRCHSLPI